MRARSDSGRPLVATVPDSPHALVYRDIARQVWASLTGTGDVTIKPPPRIIIE